MKNSKHNGQFSLLKTKPKQANEKEWPISCGNIKSPEDIFHISSNHNERNAKNQREKSWQDVSVILSENVPTATEKWCKSPLYLYWECETIYSNSYSKFYNSGLLHLFVGMYILNFFKNENMILQGEFSPFGDFKKWGQNLYFLVSKIDFQLVVFQYLKNYLTKVVYWPHYEMTIESSNCWEN